MSETAIGYVRRNDRESGQRQSDAIRAFCRHRGMRLLTIEHAAGPAGLGQPAMKRVRRCLQSGAASVLVVHSMDRLIRKQSEFLRLLQAAKDEGWRLVVLDVELDTASTVGDFLAGVLVALHQHRRGLRESGGVKPEFREWRGVQPDSN